MKLPIFIKYTYNKNELTRNVGELDTENFLITIKPDSLFTIAETVSPRCTTCGQKRY